MSVLKQLDSYLESRKSSEKVLLYLTIFALIFFLSYRYLFPLGEKILKEAKTERDRLLQKIEIDRAYLKSIAVHGDPQYSIKLASKRLENLTKKLQEIIQAEHYLDMKLKELSYLLYNKKKWAHFLDSLADKAQNHHVEIHYILNNFLDVTKNLGHVLEIEIKCSGEFQNILSYINSIEQSDLIVDIYDLQIKTPHPLTTTLKVSVWGINY